MAFVPRIRAQSKKYFGKSIPFWYSYSRGGKTTFVSPFYRGPAQVVIEALTKDPKSWLTKNKRQTNRAEKDMDAWYAAHPIGKALPLSIYLALLKEVYNVFLAAHIHFQIASQIDDPLQAQLLLIFKNSKLTKKEIFSLCVSDEKSAGAFHDEKLAELRLWCRKNHVVLTTRNFEKHLKNKTFRKKLQACFEKGYFLSAGYGGVKLWNLADEYAMLREYKSQPKSQERKVGSLAKLTSQQRQWVEIARYLSYLRDRRKIFQQRFFTILRRFWKISQGLLVFPDVSWSICISISCSEKYCHNK